MEENNKMEQIIAKLLDGFNKAQQQKPNLDVDTYIMEHLKDFEADSIKDEVKESLDFITDIDKNTAKVLKDTKKMRLDSWFRQNVTEQFKTQKEREEFEKGIENASEEIMKQSFNEFEEEGE